MSFKKGDVVETYSGRRFTVTHMDGSYVYGDGVGANYFADCKLVSPKFLPGDVINVSTNGLKSVHVIRTGGGFVYYKHSTYSNANCSEHNATLVSRPSADAKILDLLKAGKKIDAIKEHRITYGTTLKEAKDAVEAIASKIKTPTVVVPKPKFKAGDTVKHRSYSKHYVINDVREDGFFYVKEYATAGYNDPEFYELVAPRTPSIVVRHDIGKGYRPNDKPRVHDTIAEATKEAERLALANPGVRFDTFTLANSSTATAPVAGTVTTVSA